MLFMSSLIWSHLILGRLVNSCQANLAWSREKPNLEVFPFGWMGRGGGVGSDETDTTLTRYVAPLIEGVRQKKKKIRVSCGPNYYKILRFNFCGAKVCQ